MREFVFRAFEKSLGMSEPFGLGESPRWIKGHKQVMTVWSFPLEYVEVIQFTGLYDSTSWEDLTEEDRKLWARYHLPSEWKGRKIYEGDILDQSMFPEDDPCPWVVVFEDGSFRRKYPEWDETLRKPTLSDFDIRELQNKVIGNIHQNPELLK